MTPSANKAATWRAPLLWAATLLASVASAPATASDFSGLAPIDARDYGVTLEKLESFEQPADAPYSGWMAAGIFAAVFEDRMEFFVRSDDQQVRFGYPRYCHVTVPRFLDGEALEDPVTLAFMVLQDDTARYCEGREVIKFAVKTGDGGYRLPLLFAHRGDTVEPPVKFGRQTPLSFDPQTGFRLDMEAGFDVDYCRFPLGSKLEELSAQLASRWDAMAECAYVNFASGIATEINPDLQLPEGTRDARKGILRVVKRNGDKGALEEGFVNDRLYRQAFADRVVFYGLHDANDRPALYPEDFAIDLVMEDDYLTDEGYEEEGASSPDLSRLSMCKMTVTYAELTPPITPETDFTALAQKLMPYCRGSAERRKIMYDYAQSLKGPG